MRSEFENVVCKMHEPCRSSRQLPSVSQKNNEQEEEDRQLTQTPLVLKSPPQLDHSRMPIKRLERIPLDQNILRLLLPFDVLLVEDFEGVVSEGRVEGRDVSDLQRGKRARRQKVSMEKRQEGGRRRGRTVE